MRFATGAILQMLVVLSMFSTAAASDSQLKDGFELGKFFASSSMLALEIDSIESLAEQFDLGSTSLGDLLGSTNAANDDEVSIVHAYAIWRLHGLIIPLCEGGLKDGSLDPEVLGSLAGDTQLVLTDIYLAAQKFADNEELSGMSDFAKQARAKEFVIRLLTLAKGAKLKVHPTDNSEENE